MLKYLYIFRFFRYFAVRFAEYAEKAAKIDAFGRDMRLLYSRITLCE